MRRHVLQVLSVAAAAGAAVFVTAGLAPAGTASAAATARAAPQAVITTAAQGGYVTGGGRHFRFIQTTVQVSPARTVTQYAAVVLGGSDNSVPALYLWVKAGGGANSVEWSIASRPGGLGGGGTLAKLSPGVGDKLRLSIYYDRATRSAYYTAVDTTKGVSQTAREGGGGSGPVYSYTAAEAAVFEFGYGAPVANDFKLWSYTDCHVTTYSGIKGTMLGPWTTSKLVAVNSSGQVVMGPSVLFSNGADFNVLRR